MIRHLPLELFFYSLGLLLCINIYAIPASASSIHPPKIKIVTGGTLNFPHSLQSGDKNNVYFESFYKASIPVIKVRNTKISLFLRGFYSKDSQLLSFNNKSKLSVSLSFQRKLHKTFTLTGTVKYDHDYRPLTGQVKSGIRANISYFFYKSWWWNKPENHTGWFRQKAWTQAWGVFTYPDSLEKGNTNLAFSTGLEAAVAFVRPKFKMQYVPFLQLNFARDSYKLSFNNKIIPAVGFKFRYPVKSGEFTLGVKYSVDRRWIAGTTNYGAIAFGGWYRAF